MISELTRRQAGKWLARSALGGLLLPAACGKPADGAADGAAAGASLVLGDQVGLIRARMEAAGVLNDVPFRFTWTSFAGAAPLFEAIAAGAVDTGPAGDTPVIAAAAAGVPIRIIAATHSSGASVAILVPKDSTIRRITDLRGRKVIVSSARGSIAQHLLLTALRREGVAPEELSIGFMLPGDATAGFDSGAFDAWATFGLYQAVAESRGARVLLTGEGISSGIGLITASRKALDDPGKRAALRIFLQRLAQANQWALSHPEEHAALFSRLTGAPLAITRVLVTRDLSGLEPPGPAIVNGLQQVADFFQAEGLLPAPVKIIDLVEPGLL